MKRRANDKLIVFVIVRFKPRYIKMADALRKRGYDLIFIMGDNQYNREMFQGRHSKVRVLFFKNPEEALYICKEYKPLVFHVFVEKEYSVAYMLIRHKDELGKIIYSEYDLFWGYYRNSFKKSAKRAVEKEKYCFENADGICFRDWGGNFLEQYSDYNIKGKWIMLLDGCSEIKVKPGHFSSDELHLCYVGEVRSEKQFKNKDDTRLLQLAQRCEKEHVYLHVYPSVKNDVLFSTYISLSSRMKYFQFYDPLPHSDLIYQISAYDYGIEHANKNTEQQYMTEKMVIYGSSNKYFDYLDAELPIIAPLGIRQGKELEEKGVCVREDVMEVDFNYLRSVKEILKKAVLAAKEEYSMDQHIQKLIDLYIQ